LDGSLAAKAPQGLVGANGDACHLPELLRVKGGLLLSPPRPGSDEAESCFMRSLELSRRHGAPAWELRTAIDLVILLDGQGRSDSARTLLQPAFDKFADGSDTADLKAARRLLARLD
jgi:predicted ATPase